MSPTALNSSVTNLTHGGPFLTRSGVVDWRDKGSQLLALNRSNPRGPKECKVLISPSVFCSAKFETQSNILIDPNGNPRLTDFGFSLITRNISSVHASTPNGRGPTRWRAPELLALSTKAKDQDKVKLARPTKKSDAYSFAMVVMEVAVSCKIPSSPCLSTFRKPLGVYREVPLRFVQ